VFIGNWDTPFKRTISPTNVGGNDTGVWGTANLLTAGSTTLNGNASRANFKRRQNHLISYDSPNFAGFQVMAAYTSTNFSTAVTTGASNSKQRLFSLGAQYSAGPIYVSAGYEQHRDAIGPTAAGTPDLDDDAWHVGAAYTWGPVRFGGQYTRQSFDHLAGGSSRVSNWHVGVDWRIVGPHGLRAAYTRAGDVKGTGVAVVGTQGQTRPAPGGNTGADMMQIRYVYTFSKRTEFNFGFVKLNNDDNAAYVLGGLSGGPGGLLPGDSQSAWAFALRHTF
jgi:predicted porin